ncbi:uncharacterized protein LOC136035395 isoform X2 [Artemia franciscana]|uniref:uncharacterized protein LOC136035395 isoform X2 n=1 Tax=Artemia franciscana TaxID=6661 RepID=UPI0032DA5CE7
MERGMSTNSGCHDGPGQGSSVTQMLALSLLDTIISQAPIGRVASYAAKRGYIRHLLDILSGLYESLISLVCQKLSSFFTRMAMTSRGSQLL